MNCESFYIGRHPVAHLQPEIQEEKTSIFDWIGFRRKVLSQEHKPKTHHPEDIILPNRILREEKE